MKVKKLSLQEQFICSKTVFNKNQVHRHNNQQTGQTTPKAYCSKQQCSREFNTVSKGQGLRGLL